MITHTFTKYSYGFGAIVCKVKILEFYDEKRKQYTPRELKLIGHFDGVKEICWCLVVFETFQLHTQLTKNDLIIYTSTFNNSDIQVIFLCELMNGNW